MLRKGSDKVVSFLRTCSASYSEDGDEGDTRWISRTTNWRANLRYADDIILLATWEAELQELVDCLDRVSRKYSLLSNVFTKPRQW